MPGSRKLGYLLLVSLMGMLIACRPVDPRLELGADELTPGGAPSATIPAATSPTRVANPLSPTDDQVEFGSEMSDTLIVLHTNDTWGQIDPCG